MAKRIDTAEQILKELLSEMAADDGRIYVDVKARLKGFGAPKIERLLMRAHKLLNVNAEGKS